MGFAGVFEGEFVVDEVIHDGGDDGGEAKNASAFDEFVGEGEVKVR